MPSLWIHHAGLLLGVPSSTVIDSDSAFSICLTGTYFLISFHFDLDFHVGFLCHHAYKRSSGEIFIIGK